MDHSGELRDYAAKLKKEEDKWYKQNIKGEKDNSVIFNKCLERSANVMNGGLRLEDFYPKNKFYNGTYHYGRVGNNLNVLYNMGDARVGRVWLDSVKNHFDKLPQSVTNSKEFWLELSRYKNRWSFAGDALESILKSMPDEFKDDKEFVDKLTANIYNRPEVKIVGKQDISDTKDANPDLFPEDLPINTTIKKSGPVKQQANQQANE